MLKPFQIIENQKKVIENLRFKLKYSKNKQKDATDINALIKTLKCFDGMLVSKYKTDAVETLILSLIYEYLLMFKAYKNEIPLDFIKYNIQKDITNGAEHKKNEVISILKQNELLNKLKDNTVFDKNYINFEFLLNELLNNFKTDIVWNLQK